MILPLLSATFAAVALLIYVVLDGFDLGVGILLPLSRGRAARDHMIDSITPTWDGNETWLIMAGVTLLAGFPIAYGILLPALYLPVIVMLLSLGLRGVSFEFRVQSRKHHLCWDMIFALGSTSAAFMQGIMLGSLLDGIRTEGLRFTGDVLDILRPLPILSGVTLVVGYTVLGGGWLYFKGNTIVQRFTTRIVRSASICFACLFAITCFYAFHTAFGVTTAWAVHPMILSALASFFIVLSGCIVAICGKRRPLMPFLLSVIQFAVGMAGIAVIVYPDIVPFRVTIWEAAASDMSQIFLLVGAVIVTPVVIGYSAFAYWVFRGKTPAKGWEE